MRCESYEVGAEPVLREGGAVKKRGRATLDDVAGPKSGMAVVVDPNHDILKTRTIRMTLYAWGDDAERLRAAGVVDVHEQEKKS